MWRLSTLQCLLFNYLMYFIFCIQQISSDSVLAHEQIISAQINAIGNIKITIPMDSVSDDKWQDHNINKCMFISTHEKQSYFVSSNVHKILHTSTITNSDCYAVGIIQDFSLFTHHNLHWKLQILSPSMIKYLPEFSLDQKCLKSSCMLELKLVRIRYNLAAQADSAQNEYAFASIDLSTGQTLIGHNTMPIVKKHNIDIKNAEFIKTDAALYSPPDFTLDSTANKLITLSIDLNTGEVVIEYELKKHVIFLIEINNGLHSKHFGFQIGAKCDASSGMLILRKNNFDYYSIGVDPITEITVDILQSNTPNIVDHSTNRMKAIVPLTHMQYVSKYENTLDIVIGDAKMVGSNWIVSSFLTNADEITWKIGCFSLSKLAQPKPEFFVGLQLLDLNDNTMDITKSDELGSILLKFDSAGIIREVSEPKSSMSTNYGLNGNPTPTNTVQFDIIKTVSNIVPSDKSLIDAHFTQTAFDSKIVFFEIIFSMQKLSLGFIDSTGTSVNVDLFEFNAAKMQNDCKNYAFRLMIGLKANADGVSSGLILFDDKSSTNRPTYRSLITYFKSNPFEIKHPLPIAVGGTIIAPWWMSSKSPQTSGSFTYYSDTELTLINNNDVLGLYDGNKKFMVHFKWHFKQINSGRGSALGDCFIGFKNKRRRKFRVIPNLNIEPTVTDIIFTISMKKGSSLKSYEIQFNSGASKKYDFSAIPLCKKIKACVFLTIQCPKEWIWAFDGNIGISGQTTSGFRFFDRSTTYEAM